MFPPSSLFPPLRTLQQLLTSVGSKAKILMIAKPPSPTYEPHHLLTACPFFSFTDSSPATFTFCCYLNIASIFPSLGPCFSSSPPKKGFPSNEVTYFSLHSLPQVPANYHLQNVAFSDHLFNLVSSQGPDNLFTLSLFFK